MLLGVVLSMMTVERRSNNYTHILKYASLFGGVEGLIVLISIIRNKLVALILGPEGMGLMSLFNSTIKLVSDSTNGAECPATAHSPVVYGLYLQYSTRYPQHETSTKGNSTVKRKGFISSAQQELHA